MQSGESFFDRVLRIFRQKMVAKANELDEPAEAIDVVLSQQLDAINQSRADLAGVAASQKRLEMLITELSERDTRYRENARRALSTGDETAARTNARRSVAAERLAYEAAQHRDEVVRQRRELEELIEEMRANYDRLRMRRESVNALSTAARAVATGHESLTPLGPDGADRERQLERARSNLAQLRAKAEAIAELRRSGAIDPVGAGEFDDRALPDDDAVAQRLRELTQ
ncbi:MAG: PspA/IM30 family protein [Vulcanimicrobiaceae bacterium]